MNISVCTEENHGKFRNYWWPIPDSSRVLHEYDLRCVTGSAHLLDFWVLQMRSMMNFL